MFVKSGSQPWVEKKLVCYICLIPPTKATPWLPGCLSDEEPACNPGDEAGTMGLIPGWERSPGGGNGNPLQYSSLGNPMDGPQGRKRVGHNLASKQQQ